MDVRKIIFLEIRENMEFSSFSLAETYPNHIEFGVRILPEIKQVELKIISVCRMVLRNLPSS